MADKTNDDSQPNRRAGFRYIPADVIGLSMNENVAKLIFGVEERPGYVVEEIGVFLTPRTMKILGIIAARSVEAIEKRHGEIVIEDDKRKTIEESFSVTPKDQT